MLSGSLSACGGNGSDWVAAAPADDTGGTAVHITGVVKHYDLEGGFYAIQGDDGATYDPTNLPKEFQKDGLAIEAEAKRQPARMGIHQKGTIVAIERIRLR
jgi:hypothetical protein